MTDSRPTADVVPAEVWVGAEDFLVRQLRLEGPIDAGDTDSTIRTLKFSNFNQPVIIERPTSRPQ
jgi:hypothetical protein